MSEIAVVTAGPQLAVTAGAGLRARVWQRFLRGPDASLLEELYVPALAAAVRYDRCCSYFSSSVLAAAARGFAGLIERLEALGEAAPRPAVRLVVNEELSEEDVRALSERGDLSRLEAALKRRFKDPRDALERQRLAMLGWLVRKGLLAVRVGVMRQGEGIVHAKFGIVADAAGDAVVFAGSGNESASGLRSNYERLEVSTSWGDPERHRVHVEEFAALWQDKHPDVHTVSLPEALRLKLIRFAPKEAPTVEPANALARQRAAMLWRFLVEAPYLPRGDAACDATALVDLWPHQRRVVEETAAAWPAGRLLCDEVGLGKTIEAILVLRRLLAGRGVKRALILLPAGLLKQWQAELREKGGLVCPYYDGANALVWPGGKKQRVGGLAQALEQDLLLLSRELVRLDSHVQVLLAADPWDLVLLDEAHAARRARQEEGDFNRGTLLLNLLRGLQLRGKARGLLLLSATPMQTHPWEPWDLLAVLGEGGRWLADFGAVRDFYGAVAAVERGTCSPQMAGKAAALVAADPHFPPCPHLPAGAGESAVALAIAFAPPTRRVEVARWLREGSPLARRMHRNTRATLRAYYEKGLLAEPPPDRRVEDVHFDYLDPAERRVYEAIEAYIDKRFDELEREKPGKGFVMTIYRRRMASSPYALRQSLKRRLEGLRAVAQRRSGDQYLSLADISTLADPDELPEAESGGKVSAALPTDPEVARAEARQVEGLLEQLEALRGKDSKRDLFFDELRRVTDDGRAVLVFSEYGDTMDYLREALLPKYDRGLACYSGDGGQIWDGAKWHSVTKDAITSALKTGKLQVLVCTDAASEGLNLQTASALINYDLPWSPSKVEQRIGRIDRIGQRQPEVRIINLFLKDSVDQRVYTLLRERCGLFERFVGPMQPVLALARRMLMGEAENLQALAAQAAAVGADPVAIETYVDASAADLASVAPAVTRQDLVEALALLDGQFGPKARPVRKSGAYAVEAPGQGRSVYSARVEDLEHDHTVVPLTPLDPGLLKLAEGLDRTGERLPLVIGSHQSGAFRCSIAYWVGEDATVAPVETMSDLRARAKAWQGVYPDAGKWVETRERAREEARAAVEAMAQLAATREREGLEQQIAAARLRLQRELGRYLLCYAEAYNRDPDDLNGVLYHVLSTDSLMAPRLRQALERITGGVASYPDWDLTQVQDLAEYVRHLSIGQRKARLAGSELDAALEDPRWRAAL